MNGAKKIMDNIYLKLATARMEVQKQCTKKSGHNKFAGFDYFELKDFLTIATTELAKVGLVALFNIEQKTNQQGVVEEKPKLTITDGTNDIVFVTPSADVNVKNANEIQNLGSKHTYLKRYLYMNALELSEADGVDATIGKEEPKKTKVTLATKNQIEMIKKLYDDPNIQAMLNFYKVDSLEKMTVLQASEAINKKMTNKENK